MSINSNEPQESLIAGVILSAGELYMAMLPRIAIGDFNL